MDHGPGLSKKLERCLRSAYRAYTRAVERRDGDARILAAHRLAAIAHAGREAHWRWATLAACCDVTAERLRQITRDYYDPGVDVGRIPVFPDFKRKLDRARRAADRRVTPRPRGQLTDAERRELRQLAAVARTNTGAVPLGDPRRKASERFSTLIIQLRGRRVAWREMSEASGHTQVGLRMRAARHGLGSLPPSVAPYRRVSIHEDRASRTA